MDPKSTDEMKKLISKILQKENYETNVQSYQAHVKKHTIKHIDKFNERIWV